MEYSAALRRCPLFRDMDGEELRQVLSCLAPPVRRWKAGAFLLLTGEAAPWAGLVVEGEVRVLREDYAGNRTLVTQLEPGDLFAEAFACAQGAGKTLTVSVQAVTDCAVLLLDCARISSPCSSACAHHSKLAQNLLAVMAEKNLLLNRRLGHLSCRSTREKVLSFLSEQGVLRGRDSFTIPFDRQAMADYLCVERSALSAVLSALRREGALDFHRSTFTLYHKE